MTQADHSKEYARNLQNTFATPPATKVAQQVANKTAMQPLLYRLLVRVDSCTAHLVYKLSFRLCIVCARLNTLPKEQRA